MRTLLQNLRGLMRSSRRTAGLLILLAAITGGAAASVPASQAYAQDRDTTFIRDTEIENTIRYYLQRIYEAAGVDSSAVSIHLIRDNQLNAFVAGGQRIFIYTGLLTRADNPGQVIGVLAHELGHITGGHLSKFRDTLENSQAMAIAGMLLGLGGAILTGDGQAYAAGASLGQQIGTRNFLQYSRANEQAADQAAMTFLDEAGMSSKGMLEFMTILHDQSKLYSEGANPYTRTHPLTEDRIAFIKHHVEESKLSDVPLPPEFDLIHQRMRAKLIGYITPQQALKTYPESDKSDPARYARSIAYMELFKVDESLAEIDALLAEHPDDPFYHETKGDILQRAHRVEEAADSYRAAIKVLPWAALIRTSLARVLLETGNPDYIQEALDNANVALGYEPDLTSAWSLKGQAHERRGETGMAYLTQAEIAIRRGDKPQAKAQAKRAMELLPEGSASWIQAQDITYRADDQ